MLATAADEETFTSSAVDSVIDPSAAWHDRNATASPPVGSSGTTSSRTASDDPSTADPPIICTAVSLHGDAYTRWIHGTPASRSTGGTVVVVAGAVVTG